MTASSEITFISKSVADTEAFGRALATLLKPGDVLAFSGPLGAGKTQLTRGITTGLGCDPRSVSSPTFVLMCEYQARLPIVHIDAYRMQGLSDLDSIGWGPELTEGAVTILEWADRMADHLPVDHLWIWLEHAGPDERRITLEPRGEWLNRQQKLRKMLKNLQQTTPCPTCQQPVSVVAEAYPFCTNRCRMADLNRWFSGSYRIGTSLTEIENWEDLDEFESDR